MVALLSLCAVASEAVGASMFIAAFVAGLAVQVGFKEAGQHSVEFTEEWGQVINLSVFFLFGLLVAREWQHFTAPRGVRHSEPDRGAHVASHPGTNRHAIEQGHGAVYGLVRSARTGVHRARPGLFGARNAPAGRVNHPARRDGNGPAQHSFPWTECPGGNQSLFHEHRRVKSGCT